MTSRECYVYKTLPNQYEQVTSGKFVLETNTRGENIGRFVCGKSYLVRLVVAYPTKTDES